MPAIQSAPLSPSSSIGARSLPEAVVCIHRLVEYIAEGYAWQHALDRIPELLNLPVRATVPDFNDVVMEARAYGDSANAIPVAPVQVSVAAWAALLSMHCPRLTRTRPPHR